MRNMDSWCITHIKYQNFSVERYDEMQLIRKLHAPEKVYCGIMLDKLDQKYKGNRYYNFLVVFIGLLFAAYMIMPDELQEPAPLILAVFISAAVAKFACSNRNRN
tara:strand:+ start:127 stop:441 length:315 start_codon:yes stop_codon:yes gene_type:complete